MELWGGAECTVNRIGDRFQDQLHLTGHHHRLDDLDRMAELGISALRFPVLWERVAPDRPEVCDWAWADERLARLRELDVRPIVGLVHHGSGPHYTSLLDPSFAPGLARHALAAARRYPWVEEWTPVNEPLTTARFSALYGHWYPHLRDERAFWTALINQIDGVRQAMFAIRSVNPDARLVQTDDLGRTYGTAALADQVAFDNTRRWMSWDLLCGRVVPGHPMWGRLAEFGLAARLGEIADNPCPPDVIGINHYLTSDRFLDHRIQRYPAATHGGNEALRYADIEAVRVLTPRPASLEGAIRDAWERYRLPIAVTEVQNGCTRDEQLRWTRQAWRTAVSLRDEEGADVRAVTLWALFGNHGWNTLLTGDGEYENGIFDVSGGAPRPTALTRLARTLGTGGELAPAEQGHGWWQRDIRLLHPGISRPAPMRVLLRDAPDEAQTAPVLITGGTGTLGAALAGACAHRGLAYVLTTRAELDLSCGDSIAAALDRHRPWAVVNAAGWVRVDDAEAEVDACFAANADGAAALARAASERAIPTVSFSSDLVFGGGEAQAEAYRESDSPAPLNVYGESKARMERAILALDGEHLIVRTAAFFSPYDRHNFAVHTHDALRRGEPFAAAADCVVTPSYVPDLCNAALDLLIDGETGVWHLSSGEPLTWAEFARAVARACGLDESLVRAEPAQAFGWRARRPASCALTSERGKLMPGFESAITRFAATVQGRPVASVCA